MKKNQKGFSVVEILLVLIMLGVVVLIGLTVFKNRDVSDNIKTSVSTTTTKTETKKEVDNRYDFTKFGISMNLLDGWEVKESTGTTPAGPSLTYNITKSGIDGQIKLNSSAFIGGFEECGFTKSTVLDYAATMDSSLMLLSWTNSSNEPMTFIVKSEGEFFKLTNNESADSIKNSSLKTGTYYYCAHGPQPGFDLGLNEDKGDYATLDSVSVSNTTKSEYLTKDDSAYADIRTMLTSIKKL